MKKIWVLVLLVSLGLNVGLGLRLLRGRDYPPDQRPLVSSREGRGSRRPWADQDSLAREKMFSRRLEHIADRLDLRPGQREVFLEVHRNSGRLLMEQKVLIDAERDQLFALVGAADADPERITRGIHELARQQSVRDSLVAETMLQEMEVLDPDQRAKYLLMMSREGGRPGGRRGRGGR